MPLRPISHAGCQDEVQLSFPWPGQEFLGLAALCNQWKLAQGHLLS